MKKPSKTYLKRKADKLFSDRVRSKGKCEFCGSTQNLQCAHFITRKIIKLRYEPLNAACLCVGCHFMGHHHPRLFTDSWDRVKGKGTTQWLEAEAVLLEPIRIEFYQEVIAKLRGTDETKTDQRGTGMGLRRPVEHASSSMRGAKKVQKLQPVQEDKVGL